MRAGQVWAGKTCLSLNWALGPYKTACSSPGEPHGALPLIQHGTPDGIFKVYARLAACDEAARLRPAPCSRAQEERPTCKLYFGARPRAGRALNQSAC